MQKIRLRDYFTWSLVFGLVLLVVGGGLLWITEGDHGARAAVGRELGAVLIATAILTAVYEPYLRRQVVRDVFRAADLREDMAETGLANVQIGTPEWKNYFED